MHELQVTERILDVVLRHVSGHQVSRILRINLRIGELSDLEEEWIQRYFDFLSRGTVAESARLAIERMPIVLNCAACGCSFEIQRQALDRPECPDCGDTSCRLVSGREYVVKDIEVM